MARPLYGQGQQDAQCERDGHRGLWYDRFFDVYPADWQPSRDKASKGEWAKAKTRWIRSVAGKVGDRNACEASVRRIADLCVALDGDTRIYVSTWHFATGLGNPHPVENGLLWHSTLGTPYIAGSAVKGLVRTWVESWMDFDNEDDRIATLFRWFGSTEKPFKRSSNMRNEDSEAEPNTLDSTSKTGTFIFFDALPTIPVTLKADVMTPHMGEWYEKGGTIASISEHKKIPADWHDPVPILFLVADKPTFQFAIAPRTDAARAELPQVMEALGMALECFGAGAKTAVGYGSMVVEPQAVRSDPLTGFKLWFEAQGFDASNKGRHSEIIDYMKDLSDVQAGKAYVKSCMNKKACSPRLWAYLNE